MKLISITLDRSTLPLKNPFTTALRSVESIDEIMITLHTKEFKAYGSAPATLAVTGDDLMKIEDDLQTKLIPAFSDYDILDYEIAFEKLHALNLCKSAQTAMDIALHDLFAKARNQPLYKYLGGKKRLLQTLYTISIDAPQAMLNQAKRAFDSGFKKLKIKLDADLDSNIKRVKLLHTKLPEAELFLDINQAFSLDQAKAFIDLLKDLPINLLEQPLKADDLRGMQELTILNKIPILADETVFNYADAVKAIEMRACHFINIKLMKCGGIYEAKKILDLCQKHNIGCMMGSMLESGISVTAALHLAYAYANVIFADLDGPTLASDSIIKGGIIYKDMEILLSNGEGLGLKLKS